MRLHTNFHDYYDHAVGYGIDENVHYNRFTREAEIFIKSHFDFPRHRNVGLLGFCGKIFPFIKLGKSNKRYNQYDWEEYEIIEYYYAFTLEEYKSKESEWKDFRTDFNYYDNSREIKFKQFFVDWSFQSDEIFLKYKVPIWLTKFGSDQNKGLINVRLKDYGFERIKDALTAFQEISMYLSNILVEQKEIAVIEDEYRIEQHGFDLKTSFRKEKKKR